MTRQHKLFWGSSYDRGLKYLLAMWPKVKERCPDAELHVCYGWETFLSAFQDNPERMAWKKKMDNLMAQPGVIHHGRLGKKELKELQQECGIWAYPTDFTEINCITALSAQANGCVPVTMDFCALSETVQSGVKVKGEIADPEVQETYLNELLIMMLNPDIWQVHHDKGIEFAKDFSWEKIASAWEVFL